MLESKRVFSSPQPIKNWTVNRKLRSGIPNILDRPCTGHVIPRMHVAHFLTKIPNVLLSINYLTYDQVGGTKFRM